MYFWDASAGSQGDITEGGCRAFAGHGCLSCFCVGTYPYLHRCEIKMDPFLHAVLLVFKHLVLPQSNFRGGRLAYKSSRLRGELKIYAKTVHIFLF